MNGRRLSEEMARDDAISWIKEMKIRALAHPAFEVSAAMRNFYVGLLTLEGATLYGDDNEFAEICLEFCRKKEKQITEGN